MISDSDARGAAAAAARGACAESARFMAPKVDATANRSPSGSTNHVFCRDSYTSGSSGDVKFERSTSPGAARRISFCRTDARCSPSYVRNTYSTRSGTSTSQFSTARDKAAGSSGFATRKYMARFTTQKGYATAPST